MCHDLVHRALEDPIAHHLHEVSYVNQQGIGLGWNIVPHAVSKNLQGSNIIVDEKSSKDAVIGVRLEAKHKIGSRTGKVVVDSNSYRGLLAELVEEEIFVKLQKPGHGPKD
uniref:Uncharacterized protein n=1 Tax=Arundo donax TaxID=35708 RepID=A0A0A8ZQE3_ARUDO